MGETWWAAKVRIIPVNDEPWASSHSGGFQAEVQAPQLSALWLQFPLLYCNSSPGISYENTICGLGTHFDVKRVFPRGHGDPSQQLLPASTELKTPNLCCLTAKLLLHPQRPTLPFKLFWDGDFVSGHQFTDVSLCYCNFQITAVEMISWTMCVLFFCLQKIWNLIPPLFLKLNPY